MKPVDLNERLLDREDGFTERKPEGPNRGELRKTIVAFANSVPEGRVGILFVGVDDSGEILGVANPDKLQRTVREICEGDCYPPVRFQCEVLSRDEKAVLAVVIPASSSRPHFAGPAYVRRGSESVAASEELFDELVASRNSKCGAILRLRGARISVRVLGAPLGSWVARRDNTYLARHECLIETCDAHVLRLYDATTAKLVSVPLDWVTITSDEKRHRLELIVSHP